MFLNKRKPAAPDQDRTALQEASAIGTTPGQKMIGIVTALAGSAILLGGFYYKVVRSPDSESGVPSTAKSVETPKLHVPLDLSAAAPANTQPAQQPVALELPPGMQPEPKPGMQPEPNMARGFVPVEQQAANPAAQPVDPARTAAIERRLSGGFGSVDAMDPRDAAPASPGIVVMPDKPATLQSAQVALSGQTALSGMLVSTSAAGTSASRIANQHMTLIKGTSITCSLDTAIQTDQMGLTTCLTDYPVYSMDGKVVLLERGTKIDGEYSRAMARGMKSIFILWTRAVTPTGVVVDLASPGTDPLGRAGLAGEVDTKFWERYGGALMFSVLQDGVAIATARGSGGNTQINLGNTQATGTTAAGEILRQNSDIMPSMSMPQGTRVGITSARDLDFSGVYVLDTVGAK
ncbi:MAG: TrbI/VirB10 family protein [Pseudomonadota bacterium]